MVKNYKRREIQKTMDNFYDIIKSIHTISKLPIHVFNENFVLKTLYVSDHIYTLPYDFKSYFDKCRQKTFLIYLVEC